MVDHVYTLNDDDYSHKTSSSAMVYKDDGTVLFAWYLFQGKNDYMKSFLTDDGNSEYEGRLRVAEFDPESEAML